MNSQSGCFCLRSRFCLQCLRPQHWTGCPQPHLYTCFQDLTVRCRRSTLQYVTNHPLYQFRPLEDGHAIGTTRWCSCWLDFATITQVGWTEDPGSEMQTLQSCQEDGRPSQHHPLAPGASPTTQGSSRYNIHPILGMTLVELVSRSPSALVSFLTHPQERDGTVVRVYGPPLELIVPYGPRLSLLQENLRVKIPQLLYIPGASRRGWVRKSSVLFFMRESLGVRLPDALGGKVEGMDDQGGAPLENCNVISIRMHVGSRCDWVGRSHSSTSFFFSSRDTSLAPK